MPSVLLVNPPFFSLRWPHLGLSLLKAGLARRGIRSEIAYWNFDLAERVGVERYTWVADSFAFVLGGDRLFAPYCFGDRLPDDWSYFFDVLRYADSEFTEQELDEYR